MFPSVRVFQRQGTHVAVRLLRPLLASEKRDLRETRVPHTIRRPCAFADRGVNLRDHGEPRETIVLV